MLAARIYRRLHARRAPSMLRRVAWVAAGVALGPPFVVVMILAMRRMS